MNTVLSSKTKTVVISPENPFVIIGERINPTGRKKLAGELAVGDFSRVRADALAQVEAGAVAEREPGVVNRQQGQRAG